MLAEDEDYSVAEDDDIEEAWKTGCASLFPEKSKRKYEMAYDRLMKWFGVAPLTENKMAIFRQTSLDGLNLISKHKTRTSSPPLWSTSTINITENPISEAVVC